MIWTSIGLFSATLLWLALCVKLTRRWLPTKVLWLVLAAALVVSMVPFNGLIIGSYIFSLTSWLSIPSVLLLLFMLVVSCCGERLPLLKGYWEASKQWVPVALFSLVSGLLLIPMAGGLTAFDPYRLGFLGTPLSWLLPFYLLGWSLVCVVGRWYMLLTLLLAAVVGYHFQVLPSQNLWDYTIDPLLVIFSFWLIVKLIVCNTFKAQSSN